MNKINVQQFIEQYGGSLRVAVAANVHQVTVERWKKKGVIPRKYYEALGISLYKKTK
jgi:hypothetical protein